MKWQDWKEEYLEILRDMGYSMKNEIESLRIGSMAAMQHRNVLKGERALSLLRLLIKERCIVFGGGPSLTNSIDATMSIIGDSALVASDGSCAELYKRGIVPDIIVTDADGNLPAEQKMNAAGACLVLHFHGDNYRKASDFARVLTGRVIVTTQAGPTEWTFNFGGFTDGDRAVLLCEEFGAQEVLLAGFDLPSWQDGSSSKKMRWAGRIIHEAEERGLNVEFLGDGQ
ncbi:MAG: 6-hydroxymethylpterin diphosphokinase MptE-like protein [Methanomassiliicoccales archaeon]